MKAARIIVILAVALMLGGCAIEAPKKAGYTQDELTLIQGCRKSRDKNTTEFWKAVGKVPHAHQTFILISHDREETFRNVFGDNSDPCLPGGQEYIAYVQALRDINVTAIKSGGRLAEVGLGRYFDVEETKAIVDAARSVANYGAGSIHIEGNENKVKVRDITNTTEINDRSQVFSGGEYQDLTNEAGVTEDVETDLF